MHNIHHPHTGRDGRGFRFAARALSVALAVAALPCLSFAQAPLTTQTLTILGGSGNIGDVATNVEYYNPATGNWQPAYLTKYAGHPITHPWGNVPGTNHWINYRVDGSSEPGAGPTIANTWWYLYRVRFTIAPDAVNATMTFSLKADNRAQVAINGVATGAIIEGAADQANVDAVFSQNVHPGENTITINVGDYGGLNGFNFRIDLSVQSSQPLEIVPTDAVAPVITAPADITAEATSASGAAVTFTASANDNIDGPVNVFASPASGSIFPLGATDVGLAASDAAKNTATASFTVTVRDTTAPALSVPSNRTAEATSAGGAVVTYPAATASDAVGVASLTYSQNSGTQFPLGLTAVNVTARDAANNATTKSFSVTVQDTIAPAITSVSADRVAEATSSSGAAVNYDAATATDAVGVASIDYSQASGSTFPLGATAVTVTAKDAAGNASTRSFNVTVRDTTAPALTAPANTTVEATSAGGALVSYAAASASDAVGVTSLTYSQNSGTQFPLGSTTVSVTAKDAANNSTTKSFSVVVHDTIAPAITSVPADIVAEATSLAGAAVNYAVATATDAVGVASISYSQASGSTFPLGTTTVNVTAKDAAGNASTRSFKVTVRDTTAPAIASVTPSIGTLWSPNKKMVAISIAAPTTDSVGVQSLKIVSVSTNEPDDRTQWQITGPLTLNLLADRRGTGTGRIYTITVEAGDAAGNTSTKTCVVTVPHDQKK